MIHHLKNVRWTIYSKNIFRMENIKNNILLLAFINFPDFAVCDLGHFYDSILPQELNSVLNTPEIN